MRRIVGEEVSPVEAAKKINLVGMAPVGAKLTTKGSKSYFFGEFVWELYLCVCESKS